MAIIVHLNKVWRAIVAGSRSQRRTTSGGDYHSSSAVILEGLATPRARPRYYLVGDFEHADPRNEFDILHAVSKRYLSIEDAAARLRKSTDEVVRLTLSAGLSLPTEEILSRSTAAAMLMVSVYGVEERLRDGRLLSLSRVDVESRKSFEDLIGQGGGCC